MVNVHDLANSKDSVFSPDCNDSGNRTTDLEYSPEFSVADDMDSVPFAMTPTDNKVSKYLFVS